MRRIGSSLLVVLLMITMLAACTGGGGSSGNAGNNTPPAGNGNNPTATQPGGAAGPAAGSVYRFEQPKQFTMLTESHASWPYDPEWLIWDLIEEQTNATIDVEVPAGTLEETLSLTIAGGNLPDIMLMMSYAAANRYGSEGALANILDYMDLMPNFQRWAEEYPSEFQMALSADGKMYIFPNEGFGETNRMVWLYRDDIFAKHQLQVPANYDELYDVLKKLKALYPDSYPLSFRGGLQRLDNMGANFGTNNRMYYDFAAGAWLYGPIQPEFKKLIEYMHKFYEEGLIPPDFLTMDTKAWQDVMSTDRGFITIDYIGRIDFFNIPLRETNPEFNLAHMAPPSGLPGVPQQNPYTHFLQSGMTVASTSNQLEDVMRFMDFFYTEEGRNIASWGKEGVTYTIVDGKKQMNKDFVDISDLRKKTGLATNGTYTWIDYDAHLSLASEELKAAYEEARKYDSQMQPMPAFTDAELEINTMVGDNITKQMEQSITNFIIGELPLDQWDAYVQRIEGLGLQQLIDTHTAAYQRVLDAQN